MKGIMLMDKINTTIMRKHNQIEEDLKELIFSDSIHPGDKLPSENVLAEKYKVSRQTVRKALSSLENDGLIFAVHGSGTFCSERIIHQKKSKNIAVVMTYLSDYIFPKVIIGIDRVLSDAGYSIILKSTNNSRSREIKCLEDLLQKDIDGMIIEPSKSNMYCNHQQLYDKFDEFGIPYLFIQGCYSSMHERVHVLMDDEKGGYLLTRHLIDTGHRHIVGIFKSDDHQGQKRHSGYVKALQEAGLPYDPDNVIWFYTEDRKVHPYNSIKSMCMEGKTIDGIVCYNDQIARNVIIALSEHGLHVPADVSVTGYDNLKLYGDDFQLTTIVHPQEKLGEKAATLLLDMIHGHQVEQKTIISPEIVIGTSCRDRTIKAEA